MTNIRISITSSSILIIFIFIITTGCNTNDEKYLDLVNVLVDFSVPQNNIKSMSGFLHGISPDKPEDSLISLLDPHLFRRGSRFYATSARYTKFKARQILVISDLWATGPGNYFHVMPFNDYTLYKRFLNDLLDKVGNTVIFDIWNEPNVGHLWVGSHQQYYECFKITHDIIRERFGKEALITGPSANLLPEYIDGFMNFCDTADIQLDIFSYHDLDVKDYENVAKTLHNIRKKYVDNPKYAHVGIKEIHVNEYGYEGSQNNPSMILSYLYNLEQGQADGACRACWTDSDSISTCFNGSIGGLLTSDMQPRASWWTHKLYAESISERVQSISDISFFANFAYVVSSEQKARIIVVNTSKTVSVRSLTVSTKNLSSLPFIDKEGSRVNIKVYEIPDTGEKALDNIVLKQENEYHIENDMINISFNSVSPLSNYILEISAIN